MWVSILSSMVIRLEMQNKTATLYRLEFCTRKIMEQRRTLLKKIQTSNQSMFLLRQTLYALRAARMIPGAQVPSITTEKIILQSLRLLSTYQNKIIQLQSWRERLLLHCKKDMYSKNIGVCTFSPVHKKSFVREKALFPDIPGSLRSKTLKSTLLEARCSALNNGKILSRSMFLKGDPNLHINMFEVFYGKAM